MYTITSGRPIPVILLVRILLVPIEQSLLSTYIAVPLQPNLNARPPVRPSVNGVNLFLCAHCVVRTRQQIPFCDDNTRGAASAGGQGEPRSREQQTDPLRPDLTMGTLYIPTKRRIICTPSLHGILCFLKVPLGLVQVHLQINIESHSHSKVLLPSILFVLLGASPGALH